MRIGLVPLDERPANTRYGRMIAAIAGAEVVQPPTEILSAFREPASTPDLRAWLLEEVPRLDALVVSLDMLCLGGLIASRTTDEPATSVVPRLQTLREVRRERPDLTTYAFGTVTRVPDADDATEEPAYWGEHGRRLYRLSSLMDRRARGGHQAEAELATLRNSFPEGVVRDFVSRRLRNHVLNLAALELAADGTLDTLVLCSDDTGLWGLGSGEQAWLGGWVERLGLGSRVLRYPGADEVGCALVARAINARAGRVPRVVVRCFPPEAGESVAPYENLPLAQTVEHQVRAVGAELVDADPDLLLVLDSPTSGDLAFTPPASGDERRPWLSDLADELERAVARGLPVAVADTAYANGGDALLVEMLRDRGVLPNLAAYSGWNTAGNTIGTALAQGCATLSINGDEGYDAQEGFLLHRLLEDWGYQALVRAGVCRALEQQTGSPEPAEAAVPRVSSDIERQLSGLIDGLPEFADRWRIKPGSTRLPWGRTFECDFELQPLYSAAEPAGTESATTARERPTLP